MRVFCVLESAISLMKLRLKNVINLSGTDCKKEKIRNLRLVTLILSLTQYQT